MADYREENQARLERVMAGDGFTQCLGNRKSGQDTVLSKLGIEPLTQKVGIIWRLMSTGTAGTGIAVSP